MDQLDQVLKLPIFQKPQLGVVVVQFFLFFQMTDIVYMS